ncbi:hypothetical protein ACFO0N_00790 [Halobium salinum]|uniref:Uncharacterized protein n=1 Tax=Halobium salinum TaxID=1364940 RepID=A0ABD5P6F6_9EURY|nr:hypothetical protein [Halobium salinum]
MFEDYSRADLLVAATYVLAGLLFAAAAVVDPAVDPAFALVVALPLVTLPPVLLRDHVAKQRLADAEFGYDVTLED